LPLSTNQVVPEAVILKAKVVVAPDLDHHLLALGRGLHPPQASSPRASSYGEEVAIIATPQTISAKTAKSSSLLRRRVEESSLKVTKDVARLPMRNGAITRRRRALAREQVQ
jgi:hypothetical protein